MRRRRSREIDMIKRVQDAVFGELKTNPEIVAKRAGLTRTEDQVRVSDEEYDEHIRRNWDDPSFRQMLFNRQVGPPGPQGYVDKKKMDQFVADVTRAFAPLGGRPPDPPPVPMPGPMAGSVPGPLTSGPVPPNGLAPQAPELGPAVDPPSGAPPPIPPMAPNPADVVDPFGAGPPPGVPLPPPGAFPVGGYQGPV